MKQVIEMTFETPNNTFNMTFERIEECLAFINQYVRFDDVRAKPMNFNISIQEKLIEDDN